MAGRDVGRADRARAATSDVPGVSKIYHLGMTELVDKLRLDHAMTPNPGAVPRMGESRRYTNPGQVARHLGYLARSGVRPALSVGATTLRGVVTVLFVDDPSPSAEDSGEDNTQTAFSAAFRERLMLAVTAVNDCVGCSWAHAQSALLAGVTEEQADMLIAGGLGECPDYELPGLLYAQHWAETDGHPDPEARQKLLEAYDRDVVARIDVTLGIIRIGNYLGNTLEHSHMLDRLLSLGARLRRHR